MRVERLAMASSLAALLILCSSFPGCQGVWKEEADGVGGRLEIGGDDRREEAAPEDQERLSAIALISKLSTNASKRVAPDTGGMSSYSCSSMEYDWFDSSTTSQDYYGVNKHGETWKGDYDSNKGCK